MNPWHLDRDLLRRYEAGHADLPLAGSIEAHLISCATCRRLTGSAVPAERLAGIWQSIEAGIDAPQPTILQRILKRSRLTHLVIALVRAVTNFPRPSLRAPGAMASAALILVIAIWVVGSSTIIGSRPRQTETVMANPSSGSAGMKPDTAPLPRKSSGSRSQAHVSEANLLNVARSLVDGRRGAPSTATTSGHLKPCLLAAIDQRAIPLAADIIWYQYGQAGGILAAVVVFQNSKRPDRLDVYVLEEDCTDGKAQLLEIRNNIPRTPYDWRGRTSQNGLELI